MPSISLKISTPFKSEFRGEVSYIEAPSIEGMIGILPGHIPLISGLKNGNIVLTLSDGSKKSFAVTSGMLRFSNNSCFIITNSAEAQVIAQTA